MRTFPILAVAGLLLAIFFSLKANPTQDLSRLLNIMQKGMTGAEDVDKFDKVFENLEGNTQFDEYDGDIARSFYNLATEFYEYGWGDSFHFGFRKKGDAHDKCIRNSQSFVAQKLQVGEGDKVLDMGCGIGGPLRGIVRMTGAHVTGLTINEFQVQRAKEITSQLSPWMQERCDFSVQDYHDVKGFEENAYDAAFYMESSLHTIDRVRTFKETYRLLKPGGRLVAMEYVTLPAWDENDPEMFELMSKHLHGNGAAKTPTIAEDLEFFKEAGFEVVEHFDYMDWGRKLYGDDVWEWWADLQFNWQFTLLPAHPWIRTPLPNLLEALSWIGLVPADVPKAAALMNLGGDGLSGLGKLKAITPQYYVLAIKPLDAK